MTVEQNAEVSGLSWTVFSGTRSGVFLELGQHFAQKIRATHWQSGQQWQKMLAQTKDGIFRERFYRIIENTRQRCPIEAQELELLARGAGIPETDLWAYNLRGDLGRDGTGCSDVAFPSGASVLIGHNEDGDAHLAGDICLITLKIDGDPDCTVLWYPGFLPSNSFIASAGGLVWGMDHIPVSVPNPEGIGRHFVARHAQRQLSAPHALRVLHNVPCAGGFSFNLGDVHSGTGSMVENVAGHTASRRTGKGQPPLWHTNHARFIGSHLFHTQEPLDGAWLRESHARGCALAGNMAGEHIATGALSVLRSRGVLNRSAEIYTLASVVVDLESDTIVLQGSGTPWVGRLSAFARGEHATAPGAAAASCTQEETRQ